MPSKEGTIHSVASTGSYMFVVTADGEIFFLHFNNIQKGAVKAAPGAHVTFDTVAPLPGKKYPMAVNAVVGPIATPEVKEGL